ncbi:MAG: hypothetical protein KDD44_02535 [Bdellovibrionales bacterium]|nr:hypothetical protein [Bdellovibrionales bacterium]
MKRYSLTIHGLETHSAALRGKLVEYLAGRFQLSEDILALKLKSFPVTFKDWVPEDILEEVQAELRELGVVAAFHEDGAQATAAPRPERFANNAAETEVDDEPDDATEQSPGVEPLAQPQTIRELTIEDLTSHAAPQKARLVDYLQKHFHVSPEILAVKLKSFPVVFRDWTTDRDPQRVVDELRELGAVVSIIHDGAPQPSPSPETAASATEPANLPSEQRVEADGDVTTSDDFSSLTLVDPGSADDTFAPERDSVDAIKPASGDTSDFSLELEPPTTERNHEQRPTAEAAHEPPPHNALQFTNESPEDPALEVDAPPESPPVEEPVSPLPEEEPVPPFESAPPANAPVSAAEAESVPVPHHSRPEVADLIEENPIDVDDYDAEEFLDDDDFEDEDYEDPVDDFDSDEPEEAENEDGRGSRLLSTPILILAGIGFLAAAFLVGVLMKPPPPSTTLSIDSSEINDLLQQQQAILAQPEQTNWESRPQQHIWSGQLTENDIETEIKLVAKGDRLSTLSLAIATPPPPKLTPDEIVAGKPQPVWLHRFVIEQLEHYDTVSIDDPGKADIPIKKFAIRTKGKAYMRDHAGRGRRLVADIIIEGELNEEANVIKGTWTIANGEPGEPAIPPNSAEYVGPRKYRLNYAGAFRARGKEPSSMENQQPPAPQDAETPEPTEE